MTPADVLAEIANELHNLNDTMTTLGALLFFLLLVQLIGLFRR